MNGFFKQKYGLILFVGIFIAMGLTYWFGIRKMVDAIRTERDDIQRMLVIRENRNHQLGRLEEYDAQYERIVNDEKQLDVFMGRDNMVEFVRQLESLAEEEGVSVVLEAREAPKPTKKKPASKPVDEKNSGKNDAEVPTDKKEKKDPSIFESLPSNTYTYLGLHVIGETEKVVRYLHKVETFPIALDIIAIEALRKENPDFSQERESEKPVSVEEQGAPLISTDESVSQEEGRDIFAEVPEEIVSKKSETKAFRVEVTADLVVYHSKE